MIHLSCIVLHVSIHARVVREPEAVHRVKQHAELERRIGAHVKLERKVRVEVGCAGAQVRKRGARLWYDGTAHAQPVDEVHRGHELSRGRRERVSQGDLHNSLLRAFASGIENFPRA